MLDTAIARMGGAELLRGVARVRFDLMTQWQRTAFDDRPAADQPSYEWHSDLRDYALAAWRNTRRYNGGGANGASGVCSPATAACCATLQPVAAPK